MSAPGITDAGRRTDTDTTLEGCPVSAVRHTHMDPVTGSLRLEIDDMTKKDTAPQPAIQVFVTEREGEGHGYRYRVEMDEGVTALRRHVQFLHEYTARLLQKQDQIGKLKHVDELLSRLLDGELPPGTSHENASLDDIPF